MKKVICVMGPTGSGKTKLSLEIAKHFKGEIINGDSVQIYQELNIGSAKIKKDEMQEIPHHLLSVAKLTDDYTVFHFQKDVRNLIEEIKTPIIVGGSGLYIKAALYDYEFDPLDQMIPILSHEEKIKYINNHDPDLVLDWKNERRVDAAYRNIASGFIKSNKQNKNVPLYDIFMIYLTLDREVLRTRLIKRLDQMIEDGLIDETKNLQGPTPNVIGYREIGQYLREEKTLDEAKDAIITASMRFAKRQKTWFLNQMKPHIYDALDENLSHKVIDDIKDFLGV
jgi:tRNA dimethylallyltransferase